MLFYKAEGVTSTSPEFDMPYEQQLGVMLNQGVLVVGHAHESMPFQNPSQPPVMHGSEA